MIHACQNNTQLMNNLVIYPFGESCDIDVYAIIVNLIANLVYLMINQ